MDDLSTVATNLGGAGAAILILWWRIQGVERKLDDHIRESRCGKKKK